MQGLRLSKSYMEGREQVQVLHGVSLSVAQGEIVALEGPSGSGKTTLLSILGCILSATSGEVRIAGYTVDPRNAAMLAAVRRRYIGFVFQQFNLFPALTAAENIEYALNIKGCSGTRARYEAERVLDAVGLRNRMNFLPRDLSGGQKQRVAIARALAGDPGPVVILADEPTANLDATIGTQILGVLQECVKRDKRALLVVTHDQKVRKIADRVVRIDSGRLTELDTGRDRMAKVDAAAFYTPSDESA